MVFDNFNKSELSRHTIHTVRTLKIRNRFTRLNGKNACRYEHAYGSEFIAKELITNQGAKGWGLSPGNFWDIDHSVDEAVLNCNLSTLFDPAAGVLKKEAGIFDFALHDLAGQILGIPVFRMLGDLGNNPIPCYDGAILMDDISPDSRPGGMKAILDACYADYDLGYRAFKLKVGRAPKWMDTVNGISRDIQVTRMVREHFPDCDIMVDANNAYTIETVKMFIDGVKDCNIYWIEEPFKENLEDFRKLRDYLSRESPSTLIADGENDPDIDLLFSLVDAGVLDVLQMDINSYGFTPWRALLPRINETGVHISPHNWGLKIKTHYTANFAAACTNVLTVEGVVDETEGVDFSDYYLSEGKITVPDRSGFGMDLIWGMELFSSHI